MRSHVPRDHILDIIILVPAIALPRTDVGESIFGRCGRPSGDSEHASDFYCWLCRPQGHRHSRRNVTPYPDTGRESIFGRCGRPSGDSEHASDFYCWLCRPQGHRHSRERGNPSSVAAANQVATVNTLPTSIAGCAPQGLRHSREGGIHFGYRICSSVEIDST